MNEYGFHGPFTLISTWIIIAMQSGCKGRLWLKTETDREAFVFPMRGGFFVGYNQILPLWSNYFYRKTTLCLGCAKTEHAIKFYHDTFQLALAAEWKLRRITAPIVVPSGKGLNDNLERYWTAGEFQSPCIRRTTGRDRTIAGQMETLCSLAASYSAGYGEIYTDMNALRPDETIVNIHSVYVDQWDWEKVITPEERTPGLIYSFVSRIYAALKRTEFLLIEQFGTTLFTQSVHFIHAEVEKAISVCPPRKGRTNSLPVRGGFIRGDRRSFGDGTIWRPLLRLWRLVHWGGRRFGRFEQRYHCMEPCITVCLRFLRWGSGGSGPWKNNCGWKMQGTGKNYFHSLLLEGKLPQTMGGGIGQSRLCMLLLQKCHIGEAQAGLWPDEVLTECEKAGCFF